MSSKKPEKSFGEKLREAREAKRLSQARLAREIGVSRHSVNPVDVVRERNEAWYRRKK